MIKKGIILAGGLGTRMSPLTKAVNKHLLPIYDKPLIFYPLSILLLSKIRDILIIVNEGQIEQYKKIIPDGKNLGINIKYKEQKKPIGIPDAFNIGKDFIKKDNIALILGDNFFYGHALSSLLSKNTKLKRGATITLQKVKKPESYGVAKFSKSGKINRIAEKPKRFVSNYAITGLYFFDNKVVDYAKKLKQSKRGELEIVDLLNQYRKKNSLKSVILGRGGAWLDTGTIEDFYNASSFVENIEKRQGFKIACLEEIALKNNWIRKKNILSSIKFYGKCKYSDYLKDLV